MNSIQELRTKKAKLYHQAKDVKEAASKENRSLTADEIGKVEAIIADMSLTQRQIGAEESLQSQAAEYEARQENIDSNPESKIVSNAFNNFFRFGENKISKQDLNILNRSYDRRGTTTQKTAPAGSGGYLVPEEWLGEVNIAKQMIGEVENIARTINTARGGVLPFPKINDTGNDAELQTEGAAITVVDMSFGTTDFNAYTYGTLVKVSEQLLNDEDTNLATYLDILLKDRIARKTNGDLTNGDGSSKPNGIITAATVGKTAAATNAITDEELMDLYHSVDPAYRKSDKVRYMMNDAIQSVLMKTQLIASENFSPIRIADDGTMFIMGKKVEINQDMDGTLAAGDKPILFGDFNEYLIRNVNGVFIKRLDQRYGEELAVGFMVYRRLDGDMYSAGVPLKVLQMAAS
jgi:HK97 family phage major capsid protein